MELLNGQQQQLVEQARTSAPPAAGGGGGGEVDVVASDLAVAHALLMRSLGAERIGGGGGGGASVASAPQAAAPEAEAHDTAGAPGERGGVGNDKRAVDPRQSIAEVAARLQAQGESADAVRACSGWQEGCWVIAVISLPTLLPSECVRRWCWWT